MIDGLLPPSSRLTRLTRAAARRLDPPPVATEPVNEIASTCGWATSAGADDLAGALDDVEDAGRDARLERQLGRAHRRHRRLLGRLEHDAVAARRAANTTKAATAVGPFQGMIEPTTPSGSRIW